jgi:hypothetical protein
MHLKVFFRIMSIFDWSGALSSFTASCTRGEIRNSIARGRNSFLSLAAGAPEGADPKVEKEDDHNCGRDEGAVVGAVGEAQAGAPERGREDEDGQEEKDACDFEPEDAADTAEGLEESADAAREIGG